MFEIEAKVRLTEADFKRLKEEIPKFVQKKEEVLNKDSYYSDNKTFSLRIRESNKKGVLNLKSKKRWKGIEINHEIELPLKSVSGFHGFLKKIGITLHYKKEKKSEIFKTGKMRIELNSVKWLGHFLEIEILAKSKSEMLAAKKALLGIFRRLGFNSADFEKKYYLELLREVGKSK
jgi:predicted adenylyl cyclase CyaB